MIKGTAVRSAETRTTALALGFFAAFTLLIFCHEPWGDELQAWNLVKNSGNFLELAVMHPDDAHPLLWNSLVFLISRIWDEPESMRLLSLLFGAGIATLVCFRSPFSLGAKLLLLSGYFLLYEYTAFSRGYSLAVFLVFLTLTNLVRNKPDKSIHYILLFLLSLCHLLSVFLALSIHVAYLLRLRREGHIALSHVLLTALAFSPCFHYFLDSQQNSGLDFSDLQSLSAGLRWHTAWELPLRAFWPWPAFWEPHWWNTQILLVFIRDLPALKFTKYFLVPVLLTFAWLSLPRNGPGRLVFGLNLVLTLCFALVFPLENARYSGFLFIGWIAGQWMSPGAAGRSLDRPAQVLLALHSVAGLFAAQAEIRHPFSQYEKTRELISGLPRESIAADYWGLNFAGAATREAYFIVESQGYRTHLVFTQETVAELGSRGKYSRGLLAFLDRTGADEVYLLTIYSPDWLDKVEPELREVLRLELVKERPGAIDKFGNLYLYRVSRGSGTVQIIPVPEVRRATP